MPKSVEHFELLFMDFKGTNFFDDFTSLKTLKLENCDFSSTTMTSLAKKCLKLQNLTISDMFFDNTNFFTYFTLLKSLKLCSYNISNSTLNCIAESCSGLQSLEICRKYQFCRSAVFLVR